MPNIYSSQNVCMVNCPLILLSTLLVWDYAQYIVAIKNNFVKHKQLFNRNKTNNMILYIHKLDILPHHGVKHIPLYSVCLHPMESNVQCHNTPDDNRKQWSQPINRSVYHQQIMGLLHTNNIIIISFWS